MGLLAFFLPSPLQRANRAEGVAHRCGKTANVVFKPRWIEMGQWALFDQHRHRSGGLFLRAAASRAIGVHFLLPLRAQPGARRGIARVEEFGRDDAVGAEMAEALAQLAPRDDQPDRVPIADRDRPDDAARLVRALVAIGER